MGLTSILNLVILKTLTLVLIVKLCMSFSIHNISEIIHCPDYGTIEFATIKSFDLESHVHVIHVECNNGYELLGRPKLLCTNGKWESTPRPECIPMCPPPPEIEYGRLSLDADKDHTGYFKKGTLATYFCNVGLQISPPESKYRVCEKGIWTGAPASCVSNEQITSCKRPKDIANGYYVQEKNNAVDVFGIGQRLHYSCNSGFVLDGYGSSVQQCLEDGTWSPRIPPNCIAEIPDFCVNQPRNTGRREMAGQTISDRLLAAKHSLAGQGLAKSVCKATTEELLGPKKKHLDYLVHCTNEPNVSIPQMANLLIERSQNTNWVVVYKALITTHHVMCYGNERFTQYLASSNSTFNLTNFVDKSSTQGVAGARQGYDMSPFIRRYARYLNEKAMSYRSVAFDFCKVKRGKEEGTLRTMNAEKLLKALPTLQSQLDALLEFDCTANDLTNGVINMCFMLLFRDLIRLFACYNDGIINLLEKYFDMNKKQCRDALDLYKKFLIRMDRVGEFLKVAENIGIDKGDIPDLTKAPNSLLDALEQHLASLEGNTPTQTASNQKNIKSGVSALSSTSNAFGTAANNTQIDESLKQQVMAEEEAAMNQYKAKVQSPSSSTNPFLMSSSPVKTQPIESQPILDLFGAPANAAPVSQQTKASDDLLQLGNPFADMFAGQPATTTAAPMTQPANNLFSTPPAATAGVPPGQTNNMWASNGFAAQPAAPATNVFATNNLIGVFDNSEPSVFDPMQSDVLKPAATQGGVHPPVMGATATAPSKVLTGDLESSLASLAENLTISSSNRNTPVQWNSPKNQPKPGTVGWQPQPMAATTGANYRPMGQPLVGGMQYPMGAQPMMGSPRMGAPQAQPPKQEVSFDPFGDL